MARAIGSSRLPGARLSDLRGTSSKNARPPFGAAFSICALGIRSWTEIAARAAGVRPRPVQQCFKRDGIDTDDKSAMTTMTAVLWLHDRPERMSILREIRDAMTPGERARLNSPISAPQRVDKILKARAKGEDAGMMTLYRRSAGSNAQCRRILRRLAA